MKKQIFLAASALALLAACSQNDDVSLTKETTPVSFTLNPTSTMTRTATTPSETATNGYVTQFADGDKVGIYQGTTTNCGEYTVNNNALTGNEIKINSGTTATFNAFSPYVESTGGSVQFSVKTDQSAKADFDASNFLTAQGSNTEGSYNVAFNFTPKLALMRVYMYGDEGKTTTEVKMNAKPNCIWTVSEANVGAVGTAQAITFYQETRLVTDHIVFTAFVPAQTIAGGTQVLVMKVGEKTYEFKPTNEITLTPGAVNKINAKIGEGQPEITTENITFSGLSVNNWDVNTITVNDGEIEEVVVPPVELISAEAGTFTANTAITSIGRANINAAGWYSYVKSGTTTIEYDAEKDAIKMNVTVDSENSIADPGWNHRGLCYRVDPDLIANSSKKFKLTIKACSNNASATQIRVAACEAADWRNYYVTDANKDTNSISKFITVNKEGTLTEDSSVTFDFSTFGKYADSTWTDADINYTNPIIYITVKEPNYDFWINNITLKEVK